MKLLILTLTTVTRNNQVDAICSNTTESSTDVFDVVTGQPVTTVWLEGGFTSVGDQEWVSVSSSSSGFVDASVFVSLPNIAGEWANESFPAIARVRNVVTSGGVVTFETRLYQANDSYCLKNWSIPRAVDPVSLSWLAVEHGAFNLSGSYFMIGEGEISRASAEAYDAVNRHQYFFSHLSYPPSYKYQFVFTLRMPACSDNFKGISFVG